MVVRLAVFHSGHRMYRNDTAGAFGITGPASFRNLRRHHGINRHIQPAAGGSCRSWRDRRRHHRDQSHQEDAQVPSTGALLRHPGIDGGIHDNNLAGIRT